MAYERRSRNSEGTSQKEFECSSLFVLFSCTRKQRMNIKGQKVVLFLRHRQRTEEHWIGFSYDFTLASDSVELFVCICCARTVDCLYKVKFSRNSKHVYTNRRSWQNRLLAWIWNRSCFWYRSWQFHFNWNILTGLTTPIFKEQTFVCWCNHKAQSW